MRARLREIAGRFFSADLRRLLKDSIWTSAANNAKAGLYVVELMILARFLSQAQLGIYFLLLGFPELVQQVLDVRVEDLMTRYLAMFLGRGERSLAAALIKLLWLVDVVVALAALGIVVLAGRLYAERVMGLGALAYLMNWYAVGLLFDSLDGASGSVLRVFGKFNLAFWGGLAAAAARLLLMTAAVLLGSSLEGLVLARMAAFALGTLFLGGLSLRLIRRELREHLHAPIGALNQYRSELLGFGFHTNLSQTLRTLAAKLDIILVGLILGPPAAAVYKIATQIAKSLVIISDPLMTAVYPRFSALFAQGASRAIDSLAKRLTLLMSLLVLPALLTMYLFRRTLMVGVAGPAYEADAGLLVIAAAGAAFGMVFFWIRPYLLSRGFASLITRGTAVGVAGGLLSLSVLAWRYGTPGAVWGFSAFYVLSTVYMLCRILVGNAKSGAGVEPNVIEPASL